MHDTVPLPESDLLFWKLWPEKPSLSSRYVSEVEKAVREGGGSAGGREGRESVTVTPCRRSGVTGLGAFSCEPCESRSCI